MTGGVVLHVGRGQEGLAGVDSCLEVELRLPKLAQGRRQEAYLVATPIVGGGVSERDIGANILVDDLNAQPADPGAIRAGNDTVDCMGPEARWGLIDWSYCSDDNRPRGSRAAARLGTRRYRDRRGPSSKDRVRRDIRFPGDGEPLPLLELLNGLACARTEKLPGHFGSRHINSGLCQPFVQIRNLIPE
jgi:hypothetical protein